MHIFPTFFLQTPAITYISKQYGNSNVFDKKIEVPNTFSLHKLNEVEEKGCNVTFIPGVWWDGEKCVRKREKLCWIKDIS